jgi:histidyl-tRNA synthetase
LIQETVLESGNLGSISGGGRYDELVGMFSSSSIPCVGASIGIERVYAILEQKFSRSEDFRENPSDCFVAIIPS